MKYCDAQCKDVLAALLWRSTHPVPLIFSQRGTNLGPLELCFDHLLRGLESLSRGTILLVTHSILDIITHLKHILSKSALCCQMDAYQFCLLPRSKQLCLVHFQIPTARKRKLLQAVKPPKMFEAVLEQKQMQHVMPMHTKSPGRGALLHMHMHALLHMLFCKHE